MSKKLTIFPYRFQPNIVVTTNIKTIINTTIISKPAIDYKTKTSVEFDKLNTPLNTKSQSNTDDNIVLEIEDLDICEIKDNSNILKEFDISSGLENNL